ncbi:MAG: hypothetical protein UX81_C0002G0040 [Parcubacteria group bacterium GW2011_GWA2_47_12]|nr:MAG: hypothetical protein UX81_C0002G0040 [Parcubacteria group bacterium GW2011_GWA2_47_12]
MKHINQSASWDFSTEPFPAFRASLSYGRNKHDREFLPVKDVTPVITYTVTANGVALYSGIDKTEAEKAKADFDTAEQAKVPQSWRRAELKATLPTLLEGRFRVIKTKEKGTIMVVPGEDSSNRCLLFVGSTGGFRGGVGVIQDGTTGTILKQCSAGNACESSVTVIALLEVGQSVAFHSTGRRTNEVYLHTWDGTKVEVKHFSKSEWDNRNAVAAPAVEDAEVL